MEPSGRNQWQPVAKGAALENGSLKRKPVPLVATSCLSRSMVRPESAVRVRQRALQKPPQIRKSRRKSAVWLVICYGVYSSALATGSLPHPFGLQFASLAPPTLST
jgi:hypothetical protein